MESTNIKKHGFTGSLVAKMFPLTILLSFSPAKAQTPTISLTRALSFGSIQQSTAYTIAYNNASASAFTVQFPDYTGSPTVSVTFILPTDLTDGYGDNLPISFGTTSGAYHANTNSTNGATTFNLSNGVNGSLGTAAHNDYFWLGGTITPGTYVASDYSGIITVVLTVTVGTQQYTASQDVNVTATLLGRVSLSATGSLDFGQIIAGTTPVPLSAQAASAPTFHASGSRKSSTVTFTNSALDDGFSHTLPFTPSVYGGSTNNQAGSKSITSGSTLARNNYYFWLGGSLGAVPSGQVPGVYSGTFALRVTY